MVTAGDVLQLVRDGRAGNRADLARITGLSRTAVSARVDALAGADLLVPGQELASTGGRPPAGLVFNKDAGVVLAAAIGRSRSQLAVFDLAGGELASHTVEHAVDAAPDDVLPAAAKRLRTLVGSIPQDRPVMGTGISLPGTVDSARGIVLDSPALREWDGVDPRTHLRGMDLGVVVVANDADALARSERLGAGAGMTDFIALKASTGLGVGLVSNGRLVLGRTGGAGEVGHTKIAAARGLPCRCGDTGCLEAVAGGWALVRSLTEGGLRVHHIREVVALAVKGDVRARSAIRDAGRVMGETLAVAVSLLNPQALVVGGDMAAAFDTLAGGLRESLYAHASPVSIRDLQILPSTYGDRAGLVGCAALALDRTLNASAVDSRLSAG